MTLSNIYDAALSMVISALQIYDNGSERVNVIEKKEGDIMKTIHFFRDISFIFMNDLNVLLFLTLLLKCAGFS